MIRTVLITVCAALLVAMAAGAALYCLAGDFVGAGLFLACAILSGVVIWIATNPIERIKR